MPLKPHVLYVVATIVLVTAAVALAKQVSPGAAAVVGVAGVAFAVILYSRLSRRFLPPRG